MAIIKTIIKTLSECYIELISVTIDKTTGVGVIKFGVKNPFGNSGSFTDADNGLNSSIEYSVDNGSNWNEITLISGQDFTSIKLNGKIKIIDVLWDASADLGVLLERNQVKVRGRINDNIEQTGTNSDYVTSGTLSFDLRPSTEIVPLRPYANDNVFDVMFRTPTALKSCRLHFKIYVDTVNTFNSENVLIWDSGENQTGWTYDGGAFPSNGALCGATQYDIGFSNASLGALVSGTYYIKIVISNYNAP